MNFETTPRTYRCKLRKDVPKQFVFKKLECDTDMEDSDTYFFLATNITVVS